jgi:hypothetical protein
MFCQEMLILKQVQGEVSMTPAVTSTIERCALQCPHQTQKSFKRHCKEDEAK